MSNEYIAIFEPDEDGWTASVPICPDVSAKGRRWRRRRATSVKQYSCGLKAPRAMAGPCLRQGRKSSGLQSNLLPCSGAGFFHIGYEWFRRLEATDLAHLRAIRF